MIYYFQVGNSKQPFIVMSVLRPDIIWFKVTFKFFTKFICCVYMLPKDHFFQRIISYTINSIISNHPSSAIIVLGNFNVLNQDWLRSIRADSQGKANISFKISNNLTNIIQTRSFTHDSYSSSNPIDLFETTHPISSPLKSFSHPIPS